VSDTVSWSTVRATAKAVSDRMPQVSSEELEELERDLTELVPQALEQVEEYTDLRTDAGVPTFRVVSRLDWVDANLGSYRYLADRASQLIGSRPSLPGSEYVSGVSLGALLGWLSSRVLGQYDLLLQQGHESSEGALYFVGPNIVQIERRMGFQRRQFRHWIALHELTHRAQFEGVPWFRPYFAELVDSLIAISPPSFSELSDRAKHVTRKALSGSNPISDYGLAGLFVSESQREALVKMTSLMSIAEGHGDWVMDRAGANTIPESWRFHQSLTQRRNSASGVAKLLQQLLGLEGKMKQYARGEAFIEAIEQIAPGSARRLWDSPDSLPKDEEFASPEAWCQRVGVISRV
jgi:coenzyme F420 biosynthesis associated uncharacterized protein